MKVVNNLDAILGSRIYGSPSMPGVASAIVPWNDNRIESVEGTSKLIASGNIPTGATATINIPLENMAIWGERVKLRLYNITHSHTTNSSLKFACSDAYGARMRFSHSSIANELTATSSQLNNVPASWEINFPVYQPVINTTAATYGAGQSYSLSTVTISNWDSVCYGEGTWVAISSSLIMTSPDGITWTQRTPIAGYGWKAVCYGNGMFVACATSGTNTSRIMYSNDGITWNLGVTPNVANAWTKIAYGNGKFVAVSTTGTGDRAMYSSDGINWSIASTPADNAWTGLCYGGPAGFVATATSGTGNRVMTSTDGINWTIRTSAADLSWRSVAWGHNKYVAVGNDGTNGMMYSTDGITWTSFTGTASGTNTYTDIAYGNGMWMACASGPSVGNRTATSGDGLSWIVRNSGTDSSWDAIAFGNNMFVILTIDSGSTTQCVMQRFDCNTDLMISSYGSYKNAANTSAGISGAAHHNLTPSGTSATSECIIQYAPDNVNTIILSYTTGNITGGTYEIFSE